MTQATQPDSPFRLKQDKPRLLELSEKELAVVMKLRENDFWQFQHSSIVVLKWDGVRCIVLDTKQI